jgi:hypothetical protein
MKDVINRINSMVGGDIVVTHSTPRASAARRI